MRRTPVPDWRPHCSACGYCLYGLTDPSQCPECGADLKAHPPVPTDPAVIRQRRWYRATWMVACLMLFVALYTLLPCKCGPTAVIFAAGESSGGTPAWSFQGWAPREWWSWPPETLGARFTFAVQPGPTISGDLSKQQVHVYDPLHIELSATDYKIEWGYDGKNVDRGAMLDDAAVELWFRRAGLDFSDPRIRHDALAFGNLLRATLQGATPRQQSDPEFFVYRQSHSAPYYPSWMRLPVYGSIGALIWWGWWWIGRRMKPNRHNNPPANLATHPSSIPTEESEVR